MVRSNASSKRRDMLYLCTHHWSICSINKLLIGYHTKFTRMSHKLLYIATVKSKYIQQYHISCAQLPFHVGVIVNNKSVSTLWLQEYYHATIYFPRLPNFALWGFLLREYALWAILLKTYYHINGEGYLRDKHTLSALKYRLGNFRNY